MPARVIKKERKDLCYFSIFYYFFLLAKWVGIIFLHKNLLSLFVVVNLPCSSERYEKIRIILNRLRKAIQSIAEIDSLEDDVAMMLERFSEFQFSLKKDLEQQFIYELTKNVT